MLKTLSSSTKIAIGCFSAIVVLGILVLDDKDASEGTKIEFSQSAPQHFNQPNENVPTQAPTQFAQSSAPRMSQNEIAQPVQYNQQQAPQQFGQQQIPQQYGQQAQSFDPRQVLTGKWGIQAKEGTVVAEYYPNGQVSGLYTAPRQSRPTPFQGTWATQPLGNGRFSLRITLQGQKIAGPPAILQIMPDGNLFNETAQAIAYRM